MSAPETSLAARAKDVFADALERSDAERGAFLDGACAGDAQLRAVVDVLLAAHGSATHFMDAPSVIEPAAVSLAPPLLEGPGTVIGRYKLLQLIGEGGFGSVFLAEQREPVVRRVALKIIKLGMDTRQVIARFEAERQALAMMDHPNIAKVLDAGATETGRPYFVMEVVRGDPITQYCDAHNLGVRERLELFEQVCHAVQHAHQKGIIHRDIKPRNVLVTIADDRPIPKVIDFGIAKATSARLTEKTLFTEHRALIGTPEYMSPEQAEMSGADIDTRSDIYSLGVLLYELLTGSTPFDARELRSAAFAEVQRIIREVDPPKPSTRLSTMKGTLPSVAAHRRTEPARLPGLVKGDLDWVVMKCLEKDRTRRYGTASGLAEELRRHLAGQPVQAAPPGRAYQLRKFARRHRVGVLAGAAIAGALLVGLIGTAVGLVRARSQRDRAERIAAFMEHTLRGVSDTAAIRQEPASLREMLNAAAMRINRGELRDSPEVELRLRLSIGGAFRGVGLYDAALHMIDPAIPLARAAARTSGDPAPLIDALLARGLLPSRAHRPAEAEPFFREILELRRGQFQVDHPDLAASMEVLAYELALIGREAEAESLTAEALQMRRRLGVVDEGLASNLAQLGALRMKMGRPAEAEPLLAEALRLKTGLYGEEGTTVSHLKYILGLAVEGLGRYTEAEQLFRAAQAGRQRVYPGERGTYPTYMSAIARVLAKLGDTAGAEAMFLDALTMCQWHWPNGEHRRAAVVADWGAFLLSQGRLAEARAASSDATAMMSRFPPPDPYDRKPIESLERSLRALGTEGGPPPAKP